MSAGETPGILEACDILDGLCLASFCLDSVEREFNAE